MTTQGDFNDDYHGFLDTNSADPTNSERLYENSENPKNLYDSFENPGNLYDNFENSENLEENLYRKFENTENIHADLGNSVDTEMSGIFAHFDNGDDTQQSPADTTDQDLITNHNASVSIGPHDSTRQLRPGEDEGRQTTGHSDLETPWTYTKDEARTQLFTAQLLDMAMRRASIVVNGVLTPRDKSDLEHRAVQKVLLDTGAIGASFVGASWIEANEHLVLTRKSLPGEAEVTLADKKTKLKPSEKVLLRIQLPNSRGEWVEKLLWFYKMDAQMQIIVGLHDIQDHYLELFVELLRAGAEAKAKARHVRSLDKIQVDSR